MRRLAPLLIIPAIVVVALLMAIYRADHPPPEVPTALAMIVHIADWHWVPEGQHGDGNYGEFLELVDRIQQQQIQVIRALDVRKVWVEG